MQDYLTTLTSAFSKNVDAINAKGQKAYMRNQFEFLGMTSPIRRMVQKPWLQKENLPNKKLLVDIVKNLWQKPEREYQFFAQELTYRFVKQFDKKDIELLEYMVTHKSWWDTVDYIAAKLMGEYFMRYPEQQEIYMKKWLSSNNIWLHRSAILFQLKYKDKVNTELLSLIIISLLGSEEFFINKAIGWMLREYSKTNPAWVLDFTNKHPLEKLSRKEALRLLI